MANFMSTTNPVNLLATESQILEQHARLKELKRQEQQGGRSSLTLTKKEVQELRRAKYLVDSAV